jgi:phage baseplate assembly protein gpV
VSRLTAPSRATTTINGAFVAGTVYVATSGTAVFNNSASVENLLLQAGRLTGTGQVTVTGEMTWNGGTMDGGGTTALPTALS